MPSAIACSDRPCAALSSRRSAFQGPVSLTGMRIGAPVPDHDSLVVAPVTPSQQMPVNLVRMIIGEVGEAGGQMRIAAVLDRRSQRGELVDQPVDGRRDKFAGQRVGRPGMPPLPDHCESRPQQARDVTGETFKSIASLGQIYGLVIDAGDARLVPADVAQDALNDPRNDIEPFVQNR